MSRHAIDAILSQVDALGLFPQAAMKIHQVASNPESSQRDMEEAISLEPALSAQILRLANSPFYGLRRNVGNLRQAIFVLGFRAIQGLALSLAVMHMGRDPHPRRREAWQHALGAAFAGRHLAARLGDLVVGDAFVAALLHDLGEVLLMEVVGTDRVAEVHAPRADPLEVLRAEEEAFGCNHADLGAACLERWGLPEALCAAVQLHHDPAAIAAIEHGPARRLAEVVWLADRTDHLRIDAAADPEGFDLKAGYAVLRASGLPVVQAIGEAGVAGLLEEVPAELERILEGVEEIESEARVRAVRDRTRRVRRRLGGRPRWRRTG